jgi:hypothetical protein
LGVDEKEQARLLMLIIRHSEVQIVPGTILPDSKIGAQCKWSCRTGDAEFVIATIVGWQAFSTSTNSSGRVRLETDPPKTSRCLSL